MIQLSQRNPLNHWTCRYLDTLIEAYGAAKLAKRTGCKARTLRRYARGGESYKFGVPASTFLKILSVRVVELV